MSGYFKLIIGPMYAGKSTELLRVINKYKILNKNIIVINHIINNRYGSTKLITHDKKEYNDCLILENLSYLEKNYKDIFTSCDVIIIEELQFFKDAYDNIVKWLDIDNKIVVAAGLDGDFMRKPFGDVLKLIPHANKVFKLNALCTKCCNGTKAEFTKRIINNNEITMVGSNDMYIAVCRKHYLE
jgi:thymidine kinase